MNEKKAIRWTLAKAAAEFGINRATLSERLKRLGIERRRGSSGYLTKEICRAVFGDIEGERLRETSERADKLALDNAERRKELVAVAELASVLNRVLSAMRQRILASANLEPEDRDAILNELWKLWNFSIAGSDKADAEAAAKV